MTNEKLRHFILYFTWIKIEYGQFASIFTRINAFVAHFSLALFTDRLAIFRAFSMQNPRGITLSFDNISFFRSDVIRDILGDWEALVLRREYGRTSWGRKNKDAYFDLRQKCSEEKAKGKIVLAWMEHDFSILWFPFPSICRELKLHLPLISFAPLFLALRRPVCKFETRSS